MSWLSALRDRYLVTADPLRTQRRIELFALLLSVILLVQLAYGGLRLAILGPPAVVEPAADSMRVAPAARYAELADEEREEIISRPLFWPGRRPVNGEVIPPRPRETSRSGDLSDVRQVGVFGSGEEAGIIALVNGKKRRILLGEEVGGWTLESIGSTNSEFAKGARRETLELRRGNVKAPPRGAAKAGPKNGGAKKKARIDIAQGAGAREPAGKEAAGEAAPAPVRDTNDSLSLGGGSSGR